MSKEFTPGPWSLQPLPTANPMHYHNLMISAESETRATFVAEIPGGRHFGWAQANARLVSQAPEMLEGLQRLLKWEQEVFGGSEAPCWEAARKLVAEITGEQSC